MGELRSIYPSWEINMKNKRVHFDVYPFCVESYDWVLWLDIYGQNSVWKILLKTWIVGIYMLKQ